jgi:hypothetical protein
MASLKSATDAEDIPSNAQLALALAIVKLKPSNTTIKGFKAMVAQYSLYYH